MLPDADIERDRALDRLDDVAGTSPLGRAGQDVAAVRTALRADQTRLDQLLDDLLEELPRDALARGDLGHRAGALAGARRPRGG